MMNYIESDMDFSPLFNSDRNTSVYLEKSALYKRLKPTSGVKSVEFISLSSNKIYFIEAKSSVPNPNNPENKTSINAYYQDLCDKIQHSLDLIIARELGIQESGDEEIPQVANRKIIFLVVVKGLKIEWCVKAEKMLIKRLRHLMKIWNMNVLVRNDEKAREYKIIQ